MAIDQMGWPADLGQGNVVGRLGFLEADDFDADRKPRLAMAGGVPVVIKSNVEVITYLGVDGPMLLTTRIINGITDASGYLCTPNAVGAAGERGLVLPASTDPDLNPSGWTYTATVKIPNGPELVIPFRLSDGETVDLARIAPVSAQPGVVSMVDPTTADRAEAAQNAAEAALQQLKAGIASGAFKGDKGADGNLLEVSTALTPGAAVTGGTLTLRRVGAGRTLVLKGATSTGTSEALATLPAGDAGTGVGWAVATVAGVPQFWPVLVQGTSVLLMGPADAGLALAGAVTWSTA